VDPVLLIILLIIAVAAIAFALFKLGFSVDKLKLKLGIIEAEASREKPAVGKQPTASIGPKIDQQALQGGKISQSGIKAPAESSARIKQRAEGEKSEIDESPIEIE
jgi:hypothetical protein